MVRLTSYSLAELTGLLIIPLIVIMAETAIAEIDTNKKIFFFIWHIMPNIIPEP